MTIRSLTTIIATILCSTQGGALQAAASSSQDILAEREQRTYQVAATTGERACVAIVTHSRTGHVDTAESSSCETARREAMSLCRFFLSDEDDKARCKLLSVLTDVGWWGVVRYEGGGGYGFQEAHGGDPRSRVVSSLMDWCRSSGAPGCEVRATGKIE